MYLGVNNYGLASKLERQNGAKCKSYALKWTKQKARKVKNSSYLPTF